MLDRIRIVLVNTSHSGNIGAVARVMKNMGLTRLTLVNPKDFPSAEATARASGADDLLERAERYTSLAEAIAPCQRVFATSARQRHLPWPLCTPRQCVLNIREQAWESVAIVFGHERSGLSNEELAMAHQHIYIPTVDDFSSLNLAQAVGILAYELSGVQQKEEVSRESRDLSTASELAGFLEHLQAVMSQVDFLNPTHPKLLKRRLQRLFLRAEMDKTEINILRGFLSAVEKKLGHL